jgi:hypothetical protein
MGGKEPMSAAARSQNAAAFAALLALTARGDDCARHLPRFPPSSSPSSDGPWRVLGAHRYWLAQACGADLQAALGLCARLMGACRALEDATDTGADAGGDEEGAVVADVGAPAALTALTALLLEATIGSMLGSMLRGGAAVAREAGDGSYDDDDGDEPGYSDGGYDDNALAADVERVSSALAVLEEVRCSGLDWVFAQGERRRRRRRRQQQQHSDTSGAGAGRDNCGDGLLSPALCMALDACSWCHSAATAREASAGALGSTAAPPPQPLPLLRPLVERAFALFDDTTDAADGSNSLGGTSTCGALLRACEAAGMHAEAGVLREQLRGGEDAQSLPWGADSVYNNRSRDAPY